MVYAITRGELDAIRAMAESGDCEAVVREVQSVRRRNGRFSANPRSASIVEFVSSPRNRAASPAEFNRDAQVQ